ncbi:hypothetical protein PM082_010205 [Marasmius tenuissimus]|nr:hypothetical protein PM082_010205 [Marasmius tenuissimus]
MEATVGREQTGKFTGSQLLLYWMHRKRSYQVDSTIHATIIPAGVHELTTGRVGYTEHLGDLSKWRRDIVNDIAGYTWGGSRRKTLRPGEFHWPIGEMPQEADGTVPQDHSILLYSPLSRSPTLLPFAGAPILGSIYDEYA